MSISKGDSKRSLYVFLLVTQCAIFGFSFVVVKKLLDYGCPTFLLMSIRFFIGTLSLIIVGLLFGKKIGGKGSPLSFRKKEMLYGTIAGIALFLSFGLQTFGANYTTPAKNGLLTGVFVVFVPLLSMLLKRKFHIKPIALAVAAFVGAVIVSGITASDLSINVGDMLSILCGFVFAVHFLLLEKYAPDPEIDTIRFTEVQLFVVAILSVIFSLGLENRNYTDFQWGNTIGWFLFIGIISTAVTYLIQTVVQAKLSANTCSVISCSESVFAVSISLVLGYEIFSIRLLIGAIFIVTSMVIASIQKQDVLENK